MASDVRKNDDNLKYSMFEFSYMADIYNTIIQTDLMENYYNSIIKNLDTNFKNINIILCKVDKQSALKPFCSYNRHIPSGKNQRRCDKDNAATIHTRHVQTAVIPQGNTQAQR